MSKYFMEKVISVCVCVCVCVCVTCPVEQVFSGSDEGQDVSVSLLVSSQGDRRGGELGAGKGPEMDIMCKLV